ncbi:DNA polymerase alpha catalytic subunit [Orussus abietinus]|uniref:DNA polymerase alpha catalytic subunit n=1 Tax=Orussus abietinus TaxID=222816 RepID=UPI0006266BE4|nr:DNA polymerase alpha catalytic subunit [Orussus abietinus]
MDEASSTPRAKRLKTDKTGRLSALEKLKQLKGSKHKYEVEQMENVYDEVDERTYSKTVLERQNDDWIVDDGGSGYVEDGREIFDDDLDNDSIRQASKDSMAGPRKKKKEEKKSKGNIRDMFMNMSTKQKTAEKLDDDNILGDLMSELQNEKSTPKRKQVQSRNKFAITPKAAVTNKTARQEADRNNSISQTIQNDEDSDEAMFDKPASLRKEKNEKKSSETSVNIEKSSVSQSKSQEIDSDSDFCGSQDITAESVLKSKNTNTSLSQIIEDDTEDIDKYVGDLSNIDFESDSIDMSASFVQKTTTDTNVPQVEQLDKPKETIKTDKLKVLCKDVEEKIVESELFNEEWETNFGIQQNEPDISINTEDLPLTTNNKGEKVFRFFWLDATEDPYKQPGIVHLFGKAYVPSANIYVSCCIMIKNIERRIYLLPREYTKSENPDPDSENKQVSLSDVYKEFNELADKKGIKSFRSCSVSKYYAFEKEGVPNFSEYLEVRYPATYPALDPDYKGTTFETIFGTSVNALELLLIERDIKGPCWLDVKNPLPAGNSVSWCKIQVNCMKKEHISVSESTENKSPPPMIVATLNVRTSLNSKLQQNEVVMVSILLHNKYKIDKPAPKPPFEQHMCLITNPKDTPWPMHARDTLSKIKHTKVIRCETELDLLQELLNIIHKADPDLIVGYDCGFQLDVLMHRMFTLKVPNWSRIGKLKRLVPPIFKSKINLAQSFTGRLICDIQNSARELNLKVRSYDLQSLCTAVLKKSENECKEITPGECSKYYSSNEKLQNLIRITMREASYIITIMFDLNVMPLALQITCIAGNILSRTLTAGRAERNEYLLLHAFFKKNYITPDKRLNKKGKDDTANNNPRRKKAAYAGGLVLEPKKGFYDKLILLMDFNSLYPSIIQEYNLCFTTVPGAAYADSKDLSYPESDLEPGIVPTEIRKLVESRVEVKKLMKTPNLPAELKMQYNIRQMALKLTANSMYGCLGANHCRFYAKGLAALVTAKGRDILQNTKHLVETMNYDVIYGDTDSIMINTNILDYEEVFAVGKKIKQEVNKLYKKVELEIDGVFKYLLLLQKKKYAAVIINKLPNGQLETVQEHKGLDIVRRDWCQLACETGRNILDQLLSDQSTETRLENIFEILQTVAKNVREEKVPLKSLLITKQLSKNPNDYPDKKQAHVNVALRSNKEGGRMWKIGDVISYIICDDGTDKSATERAYSVDEYKRSETLKIDVNYYLLSQVLPVVIRLCDPIDTIDDVLLATHLGLDGIYKSRRVIHEREDEVAIPLTDEERFRYCVPLKFKCRNEKCQTDIIVKDIVTKSSAGTRFSLTTCSNEECRVPPWTYSKAIENELQLAIRHVISEYYGSSLECENPLCSYVTRSLPLDFEGNHPQCTECEDGCMHRIYSETMLYTQFCYYLHLFDRRQPVCKNLIKAQPREVIAVYDTLKETVEKYLKRNAYSVVDLGKLFTEFDKDEDITDLLHADELEEIEDFEMSLNN